MADMKDASVEVRSAWRRNDPELERDAIAFWRKLGILPTGVTPEERVKELCSLIYVDGEVAAVSTITLEVAALVKARLAFVRVAVAPSHGAQGLAIDVTNASKAIMSEWSLEHPDEKVAGLAAVIQAQGHDHWKNRPKWAPTGLDLVGHTGKGDQIRVAWFDHARVELPV